MSRFPSGVRFTYDQAHTSNWTAGSWRKDFIVLHWWDDPSKRPQFGGVVSWFKNPAANVSIQYVVEANRICQMIPESAMAWHAGNSTANRHGIGIEVNPRLSDGDYETTAVLVAEIWKRRGKKLPLRRHREFTTTGCPGTLDVARVQRRAEEIYSGKTTTTPATSKPSGGTTMPWSKPMKSHHSGKNISAENMLRGTHRSAINAANRTQTILNRLADVRDRVWLRYRTSLVSGNQVSMSDVVAYTQLYAHQTRAEVRELKAMVRALASSTDDVLKGQGKILKAVEDAEVKVVKANAAEVAAELEVTTKED